MRKFPEEVYITDRGNKGDSCLVVSRTLEEAVEDDGPMDVATYKLVKKDTFTKKVVRTTK